MPHSLGEAKQLKVLRGVRPGYMAITVLRSFFTTGPAIFAVTLIGLSARAVAPEAISQYQGITDRNVFGLRPPPQVMTSNSPAPLPKITLTGITTILGNKRALMKVAPAGSKPGEAKKEESMILTEGQREGEIEVLQIDEKEGSVKVNNTGTVMLLTFEKDGAKLPATAPPGPGGLPSALPGASGVQRHAGFVPGRGLMPPLPGRTARVPTGTAGLTGTIAPPTGNIAVPGVVSPTPTQAAPSSEQDLTPEEQAIVTELQRQANAAIPTFTPPPTGSQGTPETPTPSATANPPAPTQPPVLVPQ
jgi:hypothetical protein